MIKRYAQLARGGGGHASILLTFLYNFTVLATQRGAMAQCSPPKHAPAYHRNRATRVTKTTSVGLAFYGFSSNVDRIFSTVDITVISQITVLLWYWKGYPKKHSVIFGAVVVLGVCKCTGAPPLLGGPPIWPIARRKIWLWKSIANYDKKFMHLFQVSLHMYPLPQDALVPSVITHIPLSKTIF